MTDRRRNTAKTAILCLSQFQWLIGLVLCVAGVYVWMKFRDVDVFFSASSYMTLPLLLISATGVLLMFSGFLGAWVGSKDSTFLQGLFAYVIVMIFCLGGTASALALHHSKNLDSEVHPLKEVFQIYTGSSQDPHSRAVDVLQESLECCGVQNYTDWWDTAWFNRTGGLMIPLSCCVATSNSCNGTVSLPDQFYQMGCQEKLQVVFSFFFLNMIMWILALVFLQQVFLLGFMMLLMRTPHPLRYHAIPD